MWLTTKSGAVCKQCTLRGESNRNDLQSMFLAKGQIWNRISLSAFVI